MNVGVEVKGCRVCGGELESVLELGDLYLSNFVPAIDNDLPQAPLNLVLCRECNLAQLSHSVDPDLMYRQYWYKSGINETMRQELRDVVRQALEWWSPLPSRSRQYVWMDIGANDGYLLSQVPTRSEFGPLFRRIGVEPADNLRMELGENCEKVIPTYFSADAVAEQCDVVTSCAMFYDLNDPVRFCEDITRLLKPEGVWVNQISYTPQMLREMGFDNICHEHNVYYTLDTLQQVYKKAGLRIFDFTFNDINGGSVRVAACHRESRHERPVRTHEFREGVTREDYHHFARRVRKWRREMVNLIGKLWGQRIHIYGASTKGNTLLQYLGINGAFECAADRNPAKEGLMMVGTWTPIVSEEESRGKEPDYYFVLPYAFLPEMRVREHAFLDGGGRLLVPLPDIRIIV